MTDIATDLTVREVAAELGCTMKFVYNLVERHELPAIRYGQRFIRIERSALDAWKAAHTTVTPAAERAKILGEETVAEIAESAAAAPPLSEEQADTVRSAFHSRPVHIPKSIRAKGRT